MLPQIIVLKFYIIIIVVHRNIVFYDIFHLLEIVFIWNFHLIYVLNSFWKSIMASYILNIYNSNFQNRWYKKYIFLISNNKYSSNVATLLKIINSFFFKYKLLIIWSGSRKVALKIFNNLQPLYMKKNWILTLNCDLCNIRKLFLQCMKY